MTNDWQLGLSVLAATLCTIVVCWRSWRVRALVKAAVELPNDADIKAIEYLDALNNVTDSPLAKLVNKIVELMHEKHVMEKVLQDSREKYRLAIDSVTEVIWQTDLAGRIVFINRTWTDLTDYSIIESLGKPMISFIKHNRPEIERQISLLLNGESQQFSRLTGINPKDNGSEVLCEALVRSFTDDKGNICGIIGTFSDVTNRHRLMAELEKARRAAVDADRAKSEFLANMSHEIRTPMNAIMGMSNLLKDSVLTPEQADIVGTVNDAAESLLTIINDILDFSKIEAGRLSLESTYFNLGDLIANTAEIIAWKVREKKLTMNVNVADAIPNNFLGDPVRLRQIVLNLLGNAVKFTNAGAVGLTVELLKQEDKQFNLRFAITDTGIGIDEAAQALLFQPFTQADASTTRKFGGTGLGLTIAKRLVELMAGQIGVTSALGSGSEFWFTVWLTAIDSTQVAGQAAENTTDSEVENNLMRGRRVLLVEDNVANQKLALMLLKKNGLLIDVASNGLEAVAAVKSDRYDIVLMDCQMPVMDGFEATANIRQWQQKNKKAQLPIIAMTANAMQGDRERCIAAGMDDYITKPVNPNILRSVILDWLDKKIIEGEENELRS